MLRALPQRVGLRALCYKYRQLKKQNSVSCDSCFVILGGKCLCTVQNCTSHISVLCGVHFQTALSEWGDKRIHKIWIFINILWFALSFKRRHLSGEFTFMTFLFSQWEHWFLLCRPPLTAMVCFLFSPYFSYRSSFSVKNASVSFWRSLNQKPWAFNYSTISARSLERINPVSSWQMFTPS